MSYLFDAYARYYDLLYRDKDYEVEADYVATHIRKNSPDANHILELGCGTGGHAECLARLGYTVHGVDLSSAMLARAETRKVLLPPEVAARLSFSLGDVRSVRMNKTYDAVISLFHVMSYQTSNADMEAAFETASAHLSIGGLFLFDFWYGPAVLSQLPEVRVKRLEDTNIKVTRIAEPEMHVNENIVEVNYTVFIEVKSSSQIEQLKETHPMRYVFLPELQHFSENRFSLAGNFAWLTDTPLSMAAWSGFQLLNRV